MSKKKFQRDCPKCNLNLNYSAYSNYRRAVNDNSNCRKCSQMDKWTDELRKNMSNVHKGKTLSESHKIALTTSKIGKPTSSSAKLKMRKSMIANIEERHFNGGQMKPNYNVSSIPIIEAKANELGITDLQHAENGGEFYIKELGYWVDGYSKEKNIVIEFDEKNHKYQIEKDTQRQNEITEFLNCEFIRLK